jgi:hypothetical protein
VFNESRERPALIVSESENAEPSPFDVFYSIRADISPIAIGATIE